MVDRDAVKYFVVSMLKANVNRDKIIKLSHSLADSFGADSELEAEMLVREYLYSYETICILH